MRYGLGPTPGWSAAGLNIGLPVDGAQEHRPPAGHPPPVVGGTVTDPRTCYLYSLDPPANVKTLVTQGAGTGKIRPGP